MASWEEWQSTMRMDVVTLFPALVGGTLEFGVLGRAREAGLVEIVLTDPRTFSTDRHKTVDDRPYGGGEGMVMKPEPMVRALESAGVTPKAERDTARERVLLLSPRGRPFSQGVAEEFAALERLVLVCGRYEGVDERVTELWCDGEVSIGDYVLSGGELGAAVVIDAVVRLLPGALGNPDSARHESFGGAEEAEREGVRSTHASGGLLDYPHYTRPPEFAGAAVPEVLLGGDHAAIRRWRRRESLRKTLEVRPDLLDGVELSREDVRMLEEMGWGR